MGLEVGTQPVFKLAFGLFHGDSRVGHNGCLNHISELTVDLLENRGVRHAVKCDGSGGGGGWKDEAGFELWRVWRLVQCAVAVVDMVDTAVVNVWWVAHKKGRMSLMMVVLEGVFGVLDTSNAVADAIIVRKVSAAEGFWRGSRVEARKGGRGVALVNKAGVISASRIDFTSSVFFTFFSVSHQGTSTLLVAMIPAGLNLNGVATLPLPKRPECSTVLSMISPPPSWRRSEGSSSRC